MAIDIYNPDNLTFPDKLQEAIRKINEREFDPEYYTSDDLLAGKNPGSRWDIDTKEYYICHFAEKLSWSLILKEDGSFYRRTVWDGTDTLIGPSVDDAVEHMVAQMAP